MPYTPLNLGEIYGQAQQIQGAQQRQQLGALQLQEAQKSQSDREGIDAAYQANPHASLADLTKQFGTAGAQAADQMGTFQAHADEQTYRKMYANSGEISVAQDPIAAAKQLAPDVVSQFEQTHGPGSFDQLPPDQVRQIANTIHQHAQSVLIDPKTKFDAEQKAQEDKYKQEGPGGELQRAQLTQQGENARTQANIKKDYGVASLTQGQENLRSQASIGAANARAGLNPDGTSAFGTGANSGLAGDAFLQSLNPNQASQVKALADGRMQFPSGFALKSPYWQNMLSAVSQYDPNFDAVNFNARAQTRKDFTSGKSAQNIKSLNTAIGHLGTLDSQIAGTASHGFTPLNTAENYLSSAFGSSGPTQFNQTAGALASELTSVFRGSGGAEADVKRYLGELSGNASLEQKKAAVKNITELLASRTAAIGDQYGKGMGTTADPLKLLDPRAAAVLQRLQGATPDASTVSPAAAPTGVPPSVAALLQKYK